MTFMYWFALCYQHDSQLDRNDMTLAAHESFFIFDQLMYRQIDGVAMGFPLSPILTNVFLCHFEKHLSG